MSILITVLCSHLKKDHKLSGKLYSSMYGSALSSKEIHECRVCGVEVTHNQNSILMHLKKHQLDVYTYYKDHVKASSDNEMTDETKTSSVKNEQSGEKGGLISSAEEQSKNSVKIGSELDKSPEGKGHFLNDTSICETSSVAGDADQEENVEMNDDTSSIADRSVNFGSPATIIPDSEDEEMTDCDDSIISEAELTDCSIQEDSDANNSTDVNLGSNGSPCLPVIAHVESLQNVPTEGTGAFSEENEPDDMVSYDSGLPHTLTGFESVSSSPADHSICGSLP